MRRQMVTAMYNNRCNLFTAFYNFAYQVVWTADCALKHVHAGEKGPEHVVSYLPLSHIAAQVNKKMQQYMSNKRIL